jgi:hypothetical protein
MSRSISAIVDVSELRIPSIRAWFTRLGRGSFDFARKLAPLRMTHTLRMTHSAQDDTHAQDDTYVADVCPCRQSTEMRISTLLPRLPPIVPTSVGDLR